MKLGLSILSSCHLSECFLWIGLLDFCEIWYDAKDPNEVLYKSSDFWKNCFCPINLGNKPKIEFFEFKEKFGYQFSLNLFYYEKLLCCCTNPISGKKSCSWDIGQSAFSQSDCRISTLFLQNKLMTQPHF